MAPAIIQTVDNGVFESSSISPADLFANSGKVKVALPNPSPGGNLLCCILGWGDQTTTWAITDDKSNSWTALTALGASDLNGNNIQIFYVPNCAANTQVITLTPTPGTLPNHTPQLTLIEASGIATSSPVDISGLSGSSSTAVTSLTTSATGTRLANDLLIQFALGETGFSSTGEASIAADTVNGWAMGGCDIFNPVDQHFWQWQVATGTTTITPKMTVGTATAYSSVAICFKSAAAGNALGSGIKLIKAQSNTTDNATGRSSTSTTINCPCPAGANLLVGAWLGASGDLTAISDSVNGSWTSAHANNGTAGNSGVLHFWYKQNASTGGAMTVTLTTAAHPLGDTFVFYAISGAATSGALGATAATTGTQSTVAQFNTVSITPNGANNLVLAMTGVTSGNLGPDLTTPGTLMPPDENNSWQLYYTPNTSAIQFKCTPTNPPNVAPGNWASQAAEFVAAPTSGVAEDDSWPGAVLTNVPRTTIVTVW